MSGRASASRAHMAPRRQARAHDIRCCLQVAARLESKPVSLFQQHTAPVLDCCWSPDGQAVFTCSADGTAMRWDLASNQADQVAQHDAPIRAVAFDATLGALLTAGWDSKLRYWDGRAAAPVAELALPGRALSMSVVNPLGVVLCGGGAASPLVVLDLRFPDRIYRTLESPMPLYPLTCVGVVPQHQAFIVGSTEGRCSVRLADAAADKKSAFSFKCHRSNTTIYAINDIAAHPVQGSFATAGQDGVISTWDHTARQKINSFAAASQSITAIAFNTTGDMLASAVCYDWGKGAEQAARADKPKVVLRAIQEADVKVKRK